MQSRPKRTTDSPLCATLWLCVQTAPVPDSASVCVCMHFCVQLHVCTLNMVNEDGNGSGNGHTVVCYYLQMGK